MKNKFSIKPRHLLLHPNRPGGPDGHAMCSRDVRLFTTPVPLSPDAWTAGLHVPGKCSGIGAEHSANSEA